MQRQNDHIFDKKPLLPLIGFFLLCSSSVIIAQGSFPAKLDGFWHRNRVPKADSIVIEAFLDPVCPDSRDSWKPLKQAVEYYGSRVSLVVHTFALPYHANSFVCCRALHIVDGFNKSITYPLLESFFQQQEQFYNTPTFNLTRSAVVDNVVQFAAETAGSSFAAAIKQGFNNTKTDQATRIAFKYGCLRGVYGTPFFFVNGFPLPDAGSPIAYEEWRRIIDPLTSKSQSERCLMYWVYK